MLWKMYSTRYNPQSELTMFKRLITFIFSAGGNLNEQRRVSGYNPIQLYESDNVILNVIQFLYFNMLG